MNNPKMLGLLEKHLRDYDQCEPDEVSIKKAYDLYMDLQKAVPYRYEKPINKFKQAIQYLKEASDKYNEVLFIDNLVMKYISGNSMPTFTTLTNNQLDLLDDIDVQYRFRKDICEWEIDLT